MGLDALDITLRLRKSFGVKIPMGFLDEIADPGRRDVQVGRIHECMCQRLVELGRPVPHSSWHRVQHCVVEAMGVSKSQIKPESWLYEDLGCG